MFSQLFSSLVTPAFAACLFVLFLMTCERSPSVVLVLTLVIMFSKLFSSLIAPAVAALLFIIFLKKKSKEIKGGEANDNAAANDGTAAPPAHTSMEGHGMATSSGYDYEVFLSFSGLDTRETLTNHLYHRLKDAGIRTFKDDEHLRKGKDFAPELLKAIEQSKILVPIFSKNYATSPWCLKEVAKMVECQKTGDQKIIPIFYHVVPAEVRHQTGDYGKAFSSHEMKKRYDQKTIGEWKAALRTVGNINGYDLQCLHNRPEGELVRTFTQEVFNALKKASLTVSNYLVGVEDHVGKIMEIIGGAWTSETRIIGIHGMGGIGKTTIAKVVYNQLSENFDNCCSLSNIRETSQTQGIVCLQKQLLTDILKKDWANIRNSEEGTQMIRDRLSKKKVLLLLDDVDHKKHMDALVGKDVWLGEGSKLIITTKNKEVLKAYGVEKLYEVNHMGPELSLQLFSRHAFRRDYPLDGYLIQSKKAVKIAGGLPLALEVIGSLLAHTEREKWGDKLDKLKDVPPEDVRNKLRISYDALENQEKHIFLDIACLFIGYNKDKIVYFWKSEFHPKDAMDVLENLSLIKITEHNRVWMHDQLRDLGRQIVWEESKLKIEKQSRVWDPEKGLRLLRSNEGEKEVEALCLKFDHQNRCTYEDFKGLSSLTFLKVDGLKENFPTEVLQKNSTLLPQLRWLSWHNISPTFKITNFFMDNIVVLDLSQSEISQDWEGWSHMKEMKNLKVLDLSWCQSLRRTPIFSAHLNLEHLNLRGCLCLVEIDRSICQLKCLVSLDVSYCKSLRNLPDQLGGDLASLKHLSLGGCELLERLPDTIGNLKSLTELDISKTRIQELPGFEKLKSLKVMKMLDMLSSGISIIPYALWTIEKIEKIEASKSWAFNSSLLVNIVDCIYRYQSLRFMRLEGADIDALPKLPESLIQLKLSNLYMNSFPDLSNLTSLKELDLTFGLYDSDGRSFGPLENHIPRWIRNFGKLVSLVLRFNCETTSATDLSLPPQLKSLHLVGSNLRGIPELPSSLSSLILDDRDSLCSMDLSNLKKLESLQIFCAASINIQGLGCLVNLRGLYLSALGQVETLLLSNLNKLRSLVVQHCRNLVEIQGELPNSLEHLEINICESLRKLPDLSSSNGLQKVIITRCRRLNKKAISSLPSGKVYLIK